jgi:sarcosine oxidase subunit alpha
MMYRLEPQPGEWLDRGTPLEFTFEGRALAGFAGDTISSALAAAGLPYMARSFKYHRPRGILSYANHDSNLLFQVDGVPNVRGDVTPLDRGMRISAVNTFGGLVGDKARILDRFGAFLPVGFYYKAFHSKRWFPRWERMFRVLTGLGEVSLGAPRVHTPKRYAHCDVLVIGAGPSGLAAAIEAARCGARVALVDEAVRPGGSALGRLSSPADQRDTLAALVAELDETRHLDVLSATVAVGYYADHWIALAEPTRLTKMRAGAVVCATGVIEQPAVFRHNDTPGVMLASGALRLAARHAVAPGRRVVIVAANTEAYAACKELKARGVEVAAIIDFRAAGDAAVANCAAAADCAAAGVRIVTGHAPYAAIPGADGAVRALEFAPIDAHGRIEAGAVQRIDCDAVLMSVGWAGAAQLALQAGATLRFAADLQQFLPAELPDGTFVAGRLNGVYEFEARLEDGRRAGAAAARHALGGGEAGGASAGGSSGGGASSGRGTAPERGSAVAVRCPSHPFPIVDHPAGKNFVDFDEDLQVKDLENAAREGFDSSELLKRYSTVGMGPSQGKHSNLNALRVLARHRGVPLASSSFTTSRPMVQPVPLKLMAGRSFQPLRRTPLDADHAALGAVWMPAGNWRRPEYYARAGESRAQSIAAEVAAVRGAVGLIDVGTLGKIEIHGPQAGEFLDRVYAGSYSDLAVGMSRYALMLDEAGVIIDDGVVARIASDAFYFSTTTSGSATVFRELLRWNALWGLDCGLVNVTGHRAAMNFAGPASREVLQPLTDVDLGPGAFPFLGVREGHVAGVAARLLRVGFVGEWGYEIHVPASAAAAVWRALLAAGAVRGVRPFGVEAQRVLRLEKGHLIVSQDTDGLTDPIQAKALWAVNLRKPFFVGGRSLAILRQRPPRQVLVGIEVDASAILPQECHLIIARGEIAGRVTSITRSATLGRTIGLALVDPALAAPDSRLEIRAEGGVLVAARVVPTPFYDPKNLRQRAAGA